MIISQPGNKHLAAKTHRGSRRRDLVLGALLIALLVQSPWGLALVDLARWLIEGAPR
jgi:hypothetical protein